MDSQSVFQAETQAKICLLNRVPVSSQEAEIEPELTPLRKFERLIDESLGSSLKVS